MADKLTTNAESAGKNAVGRDMFLRIIKKSGLVLILVALMILATILSPKFLTYKNLFNILRQISILGVLAVGMTFVIISNGIDLSVGNVLSLS